MGWRFVTYRSRRELQQQTGQIHSLSVQNQEKKPPVSFTGTVTATLTRLLSLGDCFLCKDINCTSTLSVFYRTRNVNFCVFLCS